mmetsp:Transcript_6241/g.38779  ORF Transcript_6241/g.38779 Transcript_6241/m.38779 type:complete len:170 (+) Transcript_6241:384-893(+)
MAKTHDRTIHGWIAQDPEIREMAEQLANDPSFQAMAGQLQKQQQSGQEGAMPNIDPEAYTSAMQNLMNNPQFMQVAEKLGSEMMQVRTRATSVLNATKHAKQPRRRSRQAETRRRIRRLARASTFRRVSVLWACGVSRTWTDCRVQRRRSTRFRIPPWPASFKAWATTP